MSECTCHKNYTLDEYYDDYLKKHCSDSQFESEGDYTIDGLHTVVREKIKKYCDSAGIDMKNLSQKDCQHIFNYEQLHSEMIKSNVYNAIGYYTCLYSQKEIYDYSIKVNYEYKNEKRLVLSMIEYLHPMLNRVQYFSRCNYMRYDDNTQSLKVTGKISLKTIIKNILSKRGLGRKYLEHRLKSMKEKRYQQNKELIDTYIASISKSYFINEMNIKVDKYSFEYVPNYAFLNASNFYMDLLLENKQTYAMGIE